ncbi:MAG: isochorismatase family protein [Epulopiscium sp.]|nr:isochorismatase family protein [Candidatus Epulonipiscium sp.]
MNIFTLDKDQTTLMIIDIQDRLVPAMSVGERVINNTHILLTAAKEFNMPVVTTEQYPKGLGSTVAALKENIDPTYFFDKISFTAYTEEVKEALKKIGRKKIIITGMETHICVFQTVRDLLAADYEVFLVSDAVCSRTQENHTNGLALMEKMGAVITNTETIIFDLLKEAGTPEFKVLSKLIK